MLTNAGVWNQRKSWRSYDFLADAGCGLKHGAEVKVCMDCAVVVLVLHGHMVAKECEDIRLRVSLQAGGGLLHWLGIDMLMGEWS